MSQYINFYIKKNNTWVMIAEYSSNSKVYELAYGAFAYGELKAVTVSKLNGIIDDIETKLRETREYRKTCNKNIEAIVAMKGNSAEEKLEQIEQCRDSITWANDEIWELNEARWFCNFLISVIDIGKFYEKIEEYVWAGVEASPEQFEQ